MSGDQGVNAAGAGPRAWSCRPRHSPACPYRGARWAGANPEPAPRTDAPPTANTNRREGGEPNAASPLEELQHQLEEDGREATDGLFVEPDGHCDHGQPSWLLALGLI